MNLPTLRHRAVPPVARPRLRLAGLSLMLAALIAGCGGGGDVAGVGTGGTGSFSVGTVTGFGSVFVNGVRFEDNGARVLDDDGTVKVLGVDDNPLRVGMVVEVAGSVDASGTVRTATQIAYGAELKGPVTAVDVAAGRFTVFGIDVRTNAATVYAGVGGVASLAPDQVVEVHGQPDSAGNVVATYVERKSLSTAAFIAGGGEYRLRGTASGVAGAGKDFLFTLRGVSIRTNAATDFDGTLVEGASVSVRLTPAPLGDGSYLAQRLKLRSTSYGNASSSAEGEIEGYVSAFDAVAGTLRVAGYPARLDSAVSYQDGTAADLKNGVRIEAKGSIENGVLVVRRIDFESRDDDGDGNDDDVSSASPEFEFKGVVDCPSCTAGSGSFTLRGEAIVYDGSTEFRDGLTGATLNGRNVEVKSVAVAGTGGTRYQATRISAED
ncbi:MAG: hypothetical protein J0M00_17105 [Burkholderiales bacterium]|nr:hypothetical protein [Burkholderiales bacterium]